MYSTSVLIILLVPVFWFSVGCFTTPATSPDQEPAQTPDINATVTAAMQSLERTESAPAPVPATATIQPQPMETPLPQRPAHDGPRLTIVFSGQLLDGGEFNSVDTIGAPTLLAFWSAGCSDGRQRLLVLQFLYVVELERAGIDVVGITSGGSRSEVVSAVAGAGLSFPVVHDAEGEALALYGVAETPHYLLMDNEGAIAHGIPGDTPDADTIRILLAELRAE